MSFDSLLELVAVGDSITAGNHTGGVSYVNYLNQNKILRKAPVNLAVPSTGINDLISAAATTDTYLPSAPYRGILTVLIGVNDFVLLNMSTSTFLTNLASYCDARRAAGWFVVLCTLLPDTEATAVSNGYEAKRTTANASIVTWAGTHCDKVCDLAANSTMGGPTSSDDTTYYLSDKVHPNLVGQQYLSNLFIPSIAALAK